MALTTVATENTAEVWDAELFAEYVRQNRFKRYMGSNENSIIHIKEDLTKKRGDGITIPLIAKLSGAGATGNQLLEGNEEALLNYGHKIEVDTRRHAVANTDHEEQLTPMDLRNGAKTMLKLWCMERLRDDVVTALGSIGGIAYATATATQRNAWLVANIDRILYGTGVGAGASHNADVGAVTAAMSLSKDIVSKAKAKAETADPIIRPHVHSEDEENYVMFVGSGGYRDIKADLDTAHQNAEKRGKDNPIFNDGDLMYDGCIIRKVPEITAIAETGAGGARIEPYYLCGAQAVGVAWAKRTRSTTDTRDYGFVKGCGIHEMLGVEKLLFNNKDHGVFTGFVGAEAI